MEHNQIGVYSIKDVHMNIFCPPFFAQSHDDAKRMIADAIEPNSILARFPADYHLYFCGCFDSAAGILADSIAGLCVCSITDLVRVAVLDATHSEEVNSVE